MGRPRRTYDVLPHEHAEAVPVQRPLLVLDLQLRQRGGGEVMVPLAVGVGVDPDDVGPAGQHVEGARLPQPRGRHGADLVPGGLVLAELAEAAGSIPAADLLLHHLDPRVGLGELLQEGVDLGGRGGTGDGVRHG